jgi:hypothetical protein
MPGNNHNDSPSELTALEKWEHKVSFLIHTDVMSCTLLKKSRIPNKESILLRCR